MQRVYLGFFLALCVMIYSGSTAFSQVYDDNNDSSVGGVMIDADGMLSLADTADAKSFETALRDSLAPIDGALNKAVPHRRISLKKINETVALCAAQGKSIPDSVRYLGGLTAIEHVFIFPEENDVVLVGPAEGWTAGPKGVVVGSVSGKPVLLLDDLVVAMKSVAGQERRSVFSVSIDPAQEGLQRMAEVVAKQGAVTNASSVANGMEKALGPQVVTIQGVANNSHFAGVMAAADFRMKQISMGVTKSPVKTLPSFISMMKDPADSGTLPRWWLAPNYASLQRDAEGLSWRLKGGSVVTMTDTDFFDGNKVVRQGGNNDSVFAQWADKMTANYLDLSRVEPIFGQLRNCMDCALTAAILAENGKVNFDALTSCKDVCRTTAAAPQTVPSSSVVARKAGVYMFVTGGVSINPWDLLQESSVKDSLANLRTSAAVAGENWWKD